MPRFSTGPGNTGLEYEMERVAATANYALLEPEITDNKHGVARAVALQD